MLQKNYSYFVTISNKLQTSQFVHLYIIEIGYVLLQEIGKSITENFTEPTSDSFRNKNKIYFIRKYEIKYISDKNSYNFYL